MDSIVLHLKKFIKHFCDSKPLLLGFSGGGDSTALFYALLELQFPFHVAHIDHGWRKESAEEARFLEFLCAEKQVPYHLKQLKPNKLTGNLEDVARNARLLFFEELCVRYQLQGVMLAHHGDDQTETVLKRVFEGATLSKLKGLAPKSVRSSFCIFRPFLTVPKKQLVQFLSKNNVCYFQDITNEDTSFLRARMRLQLLPELSRLYGKQIGSSLSRISQYASELEEFLEVELAPFRRQVVKNNTGGVLHLKGIFPSTDFLLKAVLRDFFAIFRLTLSHTLIEALVQHLREWKGIKELVIQKGKIQIHKEKIILALAQVSRNSIEIN